MLNNNSIKLNYGKGKGLVKVRKKYGHLMATTKCYGAIVLAKTNYSEADLIVSFLTRELGLVSGLAKYARKSIKRFGGGLLTPGCAAWYYFKLKPNQNMFLVEKGEFNFKAPSLPSEPIIQALAAWGLELVKAFEVENNPATETFNLLIKFLNGLSKASDTKEARILSLDFTLKYLQLAGFAPHLDSCLLCGKKINYQESWLWEPTAGGLYCQVCLGDVAGKGIKELSESLLKCLCGANHYNGVNLGIDSVEDIECVEDFFEKLAEYNRGRSFRSLKVLRQLING